MPTMRKWCCALLLLVVVLALSTTAQVDQSASAGRVALLMCGGIFTSGVSEETLQVDLDGDRFITKYQIDYVAKTVSASLLDGSFPRKALWRAGVGCIVLPPNITEEEIYRQDLGDQTPPTVNVSAEWPFGEYVSPNIPPEVNLQQLNAAIDADFAVATSNTRSIVIVYKGRIIAERYAPGFTKDTPQIGWSMTKSVTNSVIGVLVGQGYLSLDKPAPVQEWADVNDNRHNITIRNLMQMSSGLQWVEDDDSGECLWGAGNGDCAKYTATRPSVTSPNTEWAYSTGTSTVLARTVSENHSPNLNSFEVYRKEIFNKIGLRSAVIDHHVPGYPLGGSNMYATARDWARFGSLFLNDGVWFDGTRILPAGWVDFSRQRSDLNPIYAAHWWLMPAYDIFYAAGYRNQNIFNMKSKDLTIVRTSMPLTGDILKWNQYTFVNSIIAAFP